MSDRCAQQMADLIESGISERDALYQEIDSLKAHAVEVLAGQLDILSLYKKFYVYVKDLSLLDEKDLKSYGIDTTSFVVRLNFGSDVLPVAEARALLGWDNDNNDKEK